MALKKKHGDMMRDLDKLRRELTAKEATLGEVLRLMNRLPPHPNNASLVANVLHSRLKIHSKNAGNFSFVRTWTKLFDEFVVVAIDAQNDTSQICVPLCICLTSDDVSDTKTMVFDGLHADTCIPCSSKRTIVACFEKSLLLSGSSMLIIDCEFLNTSVLDIIPSLLPLTHSFLDRWSQTHAVNRIDIEEATKKFATEETVDLSVQDGTALYQCLRTSYCSETFNTTQARLRETLSNDRFTEVDFGDWQLLVGSKDSLWKDYFVYSNLSCTQNLPSEHRLFARNDCDLRRFVNVLTANDTPE